VSLSVRLFLMKAAAAIRRMRDARTAIDDPPTEGPNGTDHDLAKQSHTERGRVRQGGETKRGVCVGWSYSVCGCGVVVCVCVGGGGGGCRYAS
jgi:hypothetical protein